MKIYIRIPQDEVERLTAEGKNCWCGGWFQELDTAEVWAIGIDTSAESIDGFELSGWYMLGAKLIATYINRNGVVEEVKE